tara:strand:+ start:781 stop:1662 length:882 start_codon:yes stop_codon:yes gene_type:complete
MWGSIKRQSPEAPIPIVNIKKHEKRLGGAANVASQIKALGATPILCSVIGYKDEGFFDLMDRANLTTEGILKEDRKTTIKTRIISEDKHQLRLDEEDIHPIINESDFIKKSTDLMNKVDVVIFQDYNKGVLTKNVISSLLKFAKTHQIPILVDPKKENYWQYKGVNIFKPNIKELIESSSEIIEPIDENLSKIVSNQRKKLNVELFLLTLSEKGVYIKSKKNEKHFPAYKRKIVDVSGAGDAVIATAALSLAKKLDFNLLAQFCNLAGGLSCEKIGVNQIDKKRLLNEAIRLI